MKKLFVFCLGVLLGFGGNVFNAFDVKVLAQERGIRLPPCSVCRGPAEEILKQEISGGLKRFLLAELYATYQEYDQALEILDYTKPITILDQQLAVEKNPESTRLLDYLRQQIERLQQAHPEEAILRAKLQRQAEAKYQEALAYKAHQEDENAIQAVLKALELDQQARDIEGEILVRYELARFYQKLGKQAEAVQQAQEFVKLFQELPIVKKYEEMREIGEHK